MKPETSQEERQAQPIFPRHCPDPRAKWLALGLGAGRLTQLQEPELYGDRSILKEPSPDLLPSLLLDATLCKHKPLGDSPASFLIMGLVPQEHHLLALALLELLQGQD